MTDLLVRRTVDVNPKLVDALRAATPIEAYLAVSTVETFVGAEQILAAEYRGLRRPSILRAAERRMTQLEQQLVARQPSPAGTQ